MRAKLLLRTGAGVFLEGTLIADGDIVLAPLSEDAPGSRIDPRDLVHFGTDFHVASGLEGQFGLREYYASALERHGGKADFLYAAEPVSKSLGRGLYEYIGIVTSYLDGRVQEVSSESSVPEAVRQDVRGKQK